MIDMNTKFEKGLIEYMRKVVNGLEQDKDVVRAIRRLNIKQIHLLRRGKPRQAKMVENVRRLL